MIVLDTNTVIAHLNGIEAVTERLTRRIEETAIPALVVAELDYGAKASARAAENNIRDFENIEGLTLEDWLA